MKSYFVFVRKTNGFSQNDVVYLVAVGESRRDQVKLSLIKEFCKDCGMYFEKRGDASDFAIDLLAKSLFPGKLSPRIFLRKRTLSVSDCYERILDDRWDDIENEKTERKSYFYQLSRYDSNYYHPSVSPKGENFLPTVTRKNLSHLLTDESSRAILSLIAIGVLFLFVGFLDGLQSTL